MSECFTCELLSHRDAGQTPLWDNIHRHVHFHIVPRMVDQPANRKSVFIFGYLGVEEEERVSEEQMNEIGREVRQFLVS